MSSQVSTNYRLLATAEVATVAAECAAAWQDQDIPARQFQVVKPELDAMRKGTLCAPFDALVKCLRKLPAEFLASNPKLLDVGASSGYYSEVLKLAGYGFRYQGLDYSESFRSLAQRLYPGIAFDIGDARALPFADDAFEIVLSGCCMLHILEYEKVIAETARVTSGHAIFSKTPVLIGEATSYYEKECYGVRSIEIHFGERELLELFEKHGLAYLAHADVYPAQGSLVYRTYLLRGQSAAELRWERA